MSDRPRGGAWLGFERGCVVRCCKVPGSGLEAVESGAWTRLVVAAGNDGGRCHADTVAETPRNWFRKVIAMFD